VLPTATTFSARLFFFRDSRATIGCTVKGGNGYKVAGREARNMAVNVAVITKNLVAVKGPQKATVFARSGSEGLQESANLYCQH
jgi:hypothetical protein